MDQRPGQNVDLGLYFHMEGPVSPKIRLKNQKMAEKNPKFQKKYLRVPLSVSPQGGPYVIQSYCSFFIHKVIAKGKETLDSWGKTNFEPASEGNEDSPSNLLATS